MSHAIRIHRPVGIDAMSWDSVGVCEPGRRQARLRQAAVGVNDIGIHHCTDYHPLPFTLGVEEAATVDVVGPGVSHLTPGDRVTYEGLNGVCAQVRLIAADRLVKLPDPISFDAAAAIMIQDMTAQTLLHSAEAHRAPEPRATTESIILTV